MKGVPDPTLNNIKTVKNLKAFHYLFAILVGIKHNWCKEYHSLEIVPSVHGCFSGLV